MNNRFKDHLSDQGIYHKGLSIHSLRHSAAVHLLQRYTNQLQEDLKRIYRTHHPRENRFLKK